MTAEVLDVIEELRSEGRDLILGGLPEALDTATTTLARFRDAG